MMKLNDYFGSVLRLNVPIVLEPSNFTPESRTPWGGYGISKYFKKHLQGVLVDQVPDKIGESWEFSLDPSFPSKALIDGSDLLAIIKRFEKDIFSVERINAGRGECQILVKLLEASEPLSLQVHPSDQDRDLKPHECGKPESWLVLRAEKGAGIYLGFSSALSKDDLRLRLLEEGLRAKDCLNFVPVNPGDYFEIEPGVPHAIGPGVAILEPQRVLPNREGKTFRLWDWGRLYNGKPRELHLEQGMKLINPEVQHGKSYVTSLMRSPKKETKKVGSKDLLKIEYPTNQNYQTVWVKGQAGMKAPCSVDFGFAIMTVLKGQIRILDQSGQRFQLDEKVGLVASKWQGDLTQQRDPFLVKAGMTVFLPYSILPIQLEFLTAEHPSTKANPNDGGNYDVECVFVVPTPSNLSI